MTSAEGYARALLKAAQACGALEQVMGELDAVSDAVTAGADVFLSPQVSANRRVAALRAALEGKTHRLTVAFFVLLARRHRLVQLPAIKRHFGRLAAEALTQVSVQLTLPYAPEAAMVDEIRDYLARRGLIPAAARQSARMEVTIDPGLVGGFIAEQGGRQLDLSLRSKLLALRKGGLARVAGGPDLKD